MWQAALLLRDTRGKYGCRALYLVPGIHVPGIHVPGVCVCVFFTLNRSWYLVYDVLFFFEDNIFVVCRQCHGTPTVVTAVAGSAVLVPGTALSPVTSALTLVYSIGPLVRKGSTRSVLQNLQGDKNFSNSGRYCIKQRTTPVKNLSFLARLEIFCKAGRVLHHFQYERGHVLIFVQ